MIGPLVLTLLVRQESGKLHEIYLDKNHNPCKFYTTIHLQGTYQGYGIDIALIGGVFGFEPDDSNMSDSLNIAKQNNIEVSFSIRDRSTATCPSS